MSMSFSKFCLGQFLIFGTKCSISTNFRELLQNLYKPANNPVVQSWHEYRTKSSHNLTLVNNRISFC